MKIERNNHVPTTSHHHNCLLLITFLAALTSRCRCLHLFCRIFSVNTPSPSSHTQKKTYKSFKYTINFSLSSSKFTSFTNVNSTSIERFQDLENGLNFWFQVREDIFQVVITKRLTNANSNLYIRFQDLKHLLGLNFTNVIL